MLFILQMNIIVFTNKGLKCDMYLNEIIQNITAQWNIMVVVSFFWDASFQEEKIQPLMKRCMELNMGSETGWWFTS